MCDLYPKIGEGEVLQKPTTKGCNLSLIFQWEVVITALGKDNASPAGDSTVCGIYLGLEGVESFPLWPACS